MRPKCAPPVYHGEAKRDVAEVIERNFTLKRRTMTLPQGDMDDFMRREITAPRLRPIYWPKMVEGEEEDMATSRFEKFKDDEAFSLGTGGLCGCTALVIVSRKAVYGAHYWESISFDPDEEWVNEYGSAEEVFRQTVIKGLEDGVVTNGVEEQASLRDHATEIDDDHIRAYLMIPAETWDDVPDGYRDKWNLLKSTVGNLVPKLRDNARWKEIKYDALEMGDRLLEDTARGKILFKFDPNHKADPNQEKGKKKAILWIEANLTPEHDEEWD